MRTKHQYRYSKVPQQDPDNRNNQNNSIIKKTFSEHADDMLGIIIANGAKIFAPSLYSKILRERVTEIIVKEMQKPDDYCLLARITRHKQMEQDRAKNAKEFATREIALIKEELAKPHEQALPDGFIDARTKAPQIYKSSNLPTTKQIGQFTNKVLKPISQNLAREIL